MVKSKLTKNMKLSVLFKLMYISLFCGIITPFAIRVISSITTPLIGEELPMMTVYVSGVYICLGVISYIVSFIMILTTVLEKGHR